MIKTREYLLISLIAHTLALIAMTCAILPPFRTNNGSAGALTVDIRKMKTAIERIAHRRSEVRVKSEVPWSIEPPKSIASLSHLIDQSRLDVDEKMVAMPDASEMRVVSLPNLPLLKSDRQTVRAVLEPKQQEALGAERFLRSRFHNITDRDIVLQYMYYSYRDRPMPENVQDDSITFEEILPTIARGIAERATRSKVDIVFILDVTGSMDNNISEVREYIHHFLELLGKTSLDAALGLVEFSDQSVASPRISGLTTDPSVFRKWVDRVELSEGADLAESGYEAMISAIEKIRFRESAQKFFIFISDDLQHDLDYDGKSIYTLDKVVAKLNEEKVSVDVVGVDSYFMKRLAQSTGGEWRHIPGKLPVVRIPYSSASTMRFHLAGSLLPDSLEDELTIEFHDPAPDWVDLSYWMFNQQGNKVLETSLPSKHIDSRADRTIEFSIKVDLGKFRNHPGSYTLIYRATDSLGNEGILCQILVQRRHNVWIRYKPQTR